MICQKTFLSVLRYRVAILKTSYDNLTINIEVGHLNYKKLTQCLDSSLNEGKSAASFCHQVAVWFPDMFCGYYLVKNPKIAKNSAIN